MPDGPFCDAAVVEQAIHEAVEDPQWRDILRYRLGFATGQPVALETLRQTRRPRLTQQEFRTAMAGNGIHSAATLLVHLAGAERYWICGVIGGEAVDRDREAEFRNEPGSKPEVIATFREAVAAADRVLDSLRDEDVDREVGNGFTVREILLRMIAHWAHHRGQILGLKRWVQPVG